MTDPATRPRQALLLAAGDGTRLRPLTDRVPKPMLPIDGQAVIERLVGQLVRAGIEHVTVVVGHRGDVLRAFLEGIGVGIEFTFVEQPERRGTGHALQLALDAGLERVDTIVAATDTWWRDEDVSRMVDQPAVDVDALVTMALCCWPVAQLPSSMSVLVDDAQRVSRVLHPIDPISEPAGAAKLAGSPLYAFRAPFWAWIERIEPSSGVVELATAIQQAIDDGHLVRGHEVRDARDLTCPQDLLRHNFEYLDRLLAADSPPT